MKENLNRRKFMKMVAAGTCGAACHQVMRPFGGIAYALGGPTAMAAPGPVKRMIEVFFYGGCCSYGLSPGHNLGWQTKYPTLYRTPGQATNIGHSDQSLHAAFGTFVTEANRDKPSVALICNTGHPQFYSRSHDVAQNANERIDYDSRREMGVGVGAAIADVSGNPYSLISFGGNSDFSVGGAVPARSVGSLANGKSNFWQSEWFGVTEENLRAAAAAPATQPQQHVQTAIDTMNTSLKTMKDIGALNPPVAFPNSNIGNNLADVTRLIMADVGTVYFIPYGGFDTHSDELNQQQNLFTTLNAAWRALVLNLKALPGVAGGTAWDDTVVITRTDFGRTFENNAKGTDHGHVYNQIVFGGRVTGGVYGDPLTAVQLQNASQDYLGSPFVEFSAMQPTKEIIQRMGLPVAFPDYPGNIRVPIGFI